jgi:hypothetical protein
MPRAPRPGRERRAPLDPETLRWLLNGERPDNFELFLMDGLGDAPNSSLRALWANVGATVIEVYASAHPGRRPWAWWRLAAPEMRRRLGGRGAPASEVLAYVPTFEHGIPSDWDDEECDFDRTDPPAFESQATYLRRLGLLLPGEARRLKAADFEPEKVEVLDAPDGPGPYMMKHAQPGGINLETD